MRERELVVASDGAELRATLSLPAAGPPRGGVVALHPSNDPSREQFLFRHLADVLTPVGVAVLRYDRRPAPGDVPLARQAADALAALTTLRAQSDVGPVPVGVWGFSQGAWAAAVAAAGSTEVAWLVVLAATGVSPAVQMRYGTAEHLRRAGFDAAAERALVALRAQYEDYLRGRVDRASTVAAVERAAAEPWFPLAYVRRDLPEPGAWADMDFDPEPVFAAVRCPVLAFYGEADEWSPVEASVAAWRRAAEVSGNRRITVVHLPGTGHHPTLQAGRDIASISPDYTARLVDWVAARVGGL